MTAAGRALVVLATAAAGLAACGSPSQSPQEIGDRLEQVCADARADARPGSAVELQAATERVIEEVDELGPDDEAAGPLRALKEGLTAKRDALAAVVAADRPSLDERTALAGAVELQQRLLAPAAEDLGIRGCDGTAALVTPLREKVYARDLRRALREPGAQGGGPRLTRSADEPLLTQEANDAFEVTYEFEKRLDALEPPPALERAHERLREAVSDVTIDVLELANDLETFHDVQRGQVRRRLARYDAHRAAVGRARRALVRRLG